MTMDSEVLENEADSARGSTSDASVTTDGQRLLRAVTDSNRAIATRVGMSNTIVSHWRTGTKLPTPEMRRVLASLYDIPASAWDVKVGADPRCESAQSRSAHQLSNREGAEEMLRSLLDQWTRGLAVQEVTRLSDSLVRVRKLIHELDQAEQMTETRIMTSAPVQRLRRLAFASLQPYPEALRAFVSALQSSGAE